MERKLKAILVDDEGHCLETLKFDLNRVCSEWIAIAGEAQNAARGMSLLNSEKPDILFLDIDLPGMSGLEFLETIRHLNIRVVFTTAHSKYAIQALNYKAEALLLKPIEASELKQLVSEIFLKVNKEEHRST